MDERETRDDGAESRTAEQGTQGAFHDAVSRGQTQTAADEFGRDSAEYRRQYWNRLARIDYHIAIAGAPASDDATFIESGKDTLDWLREFELCDPRSVALDIGCGVGRVAYHVAPLVKQLYAIDVSDEMIAGAQRNLAHLRNVEVKRTDGESLALFADASLDFVYSILVLQHMERANCRRMFGEIARVLRPGGKMLVQLPWSGSALYTSAYEVEPKDNDLWYARVYSEDEIATMCAVNGLAPLVIRVVGDNVWVVARCERVARRDGGLRGIARAFTALIRRARR